MDGRTLPVPWGDGNRPAVCNTTPGDMPVRVQPARLHTHRTRLRRARNRTLLRQEPPLLLRRQTAAPWGGAHTSLGPWEAGRRPGDGNRPAVCSKPQVCSRRQAAQLHRQEAPLQPMRRRDRSCKHLLMDHTQKHTDHSRTDSSRERPVHMRLHKDLDNHSIGTFLILLLQVGEHLVRSIHRLSYLISCLAL